MCVIVHKPKGVELSHKDALNMWTMNPDGGGLAYIKPDGTIEVKKYMDFDDFWTAYENELAANPDADFMLHMRIATHGKVNIDNIHPFPVDEFTVMSHNGIISSVPRDTKNEKSDTRMFIEEVLPQLPPDWLDKKYLVRMVEDFIGHSKLMFLTTSPFLEHSVYILNADMGVESPEGLWLSNKNHEWYGTQAVRREAQARGTGPKTYGSMTEYWNEQDEQTMLEQDYLDNQCSVFTKGGTTYPTSSDPWPISMRFDEIRIMRDVFDQIMDFRQSMWLEKPIAYDDEYEYWWCYGCDEEVNPESGWCECWNKECQDCAKLAAECICQSGFSNNLTVINRKEQDEKEAAF